MQLFDTHAHLDDARFDPDREQILGELNETGVRLVMNVGCDRASSERSVQMAKRYGFVYAAVGSHPDDADNLTDELLEHYARLCRENPKVRAIGEIGLDYHYEPQKRNEQIECFCRQMELAGQLKLPVIVHQRQAHEDALKIVRQFPEQIGVFHCFSGSVELAKELIRRGWYIGFTGVITFKNARKAVEVAQYAPLGRILLETDCPYMAPEPFRGKRNDSRYLYRMAEQIAQIKQLDVQTVARTTLENGCRLFGIKPPAADLC